MDLMVLFLPGVLLFGLGGMACARLEVGLAVFRECPWNSFRMIRCPHIHLYNHLYIHLIWESK